MPAYQSLCQLTLTETTLKGTDLALALKLTLEPLEVAVSPANLGVLQLEDGQVRLQCKHR